MHRRVTGCLFSAPRPPIINPIFYPIFYPINCYSSTTNIYLFQLKFHILDHFQLILTLDNTKRVLFCANPEVDFEFLEYLTFWDTFHKFHKKYPISMGKKVANGLSGCIDNPHRLDPIKKKGRPDYPFCPKFFRRPEVRTDKKLSGPSP